jgi:hypothetical protein
VVSFALIDRYAGIRLEADLTALPPDQTCVVESSRRLTAEQSYGYIHGLWWLWLADGRSVVSVPPGAGRAIRAIVGSVDSETALFDEHLAERLKGPVDAALLDAGLPATHRVLHDVVFACHGALLKRHPRPDCCRLRKASIPAAEGLRLPTHCFPREWPSGSYRKIGWSR